MTWQRVGKGSRSNVTQTDLNICAPSGNEHVRCCDWRHGCSVHFSRHLKFHDDLRKQNSAHKKSEHPGSWNRARKQRKTGNWECRHILESNWYPKLWHTGQRMLWQTARYPQDTKRPPRQRTCGHFGAACPQAVCSCASLWTRLRIRSRSTHRTQRPTHPMPRRAGTFPLSNQPDHTVRL
jgi:hypothetical protein